MQLNYYVIRELANEIYPVDDLVRACTNDENSVYNISLGDVLGVIEFLYRKTNNREQQKFLFFIKTVYSMRLYESYNKISEVKKIPPAVDKNKQPAANQPREILRNSQYSNIEEFNKLVSGSYINVRLQPLLPPDLALDYRYIVGAELYNLMTTCATDFQKVEKGNLIKLLEFSCWLLLILNYWMLIIVSKSLLPMMYP